MVTVIVTVNLVMGVRKVEDSVSCLLRFLWNLKDCLAYSNCCTGLNRRSYLAHQKSLLWGLEHFSLSSAKTRDISGRRNFCVMSWEIFHYRRYNEEQQCR